MLKTEYPYNGNVNLVRHYSDRGMKIEQVETGIRYEDAVDVYPCRYTYIETDESISEDDTEGNAI